MDEKHFISLFFTLRLVQNPGLKNSTTVVSQSYGCGSVKSLSITYLKNASNPPEADPWT